MISAGSWARTRLPGLAAELVQLNVSMILAFGNQAALAAKRATTTIPIVMLASDPVGSGLIASLARPGGNITGVTTEAGLEILSKRLELLKTRLGWRITCGSLEEIADLAK